MSKWNLVIFFTFGHLLQCIYSYPGGAPQRACESMFPVHGAEPQNSPSPFTIKTESRRNSVQVTIEDALGKTPIRGFLLKALHEDGTETENGKFISGELTQPLDCNYGEEGALTHNSRDEKLNITASWLPPVGFRGSVIFRATVLVQWDVFWMNVESRPVFVQNLETTGTPIRLLTTVMPTSSVLPLTDLYSGCGHSKGCFGMPRNCVEKRSCGVVLTYARVPNKDLVTFQMVGALGAKPGYIAMGLSRNSKMGDDSVTECAYFGDKVVIRESWNYAKPKKGNFLLHGVANITEEKKDYEDGVITCSWSRPFSTVANGITFDIAEDSFHILLAQGLVDGSGNKMLHNTELPSASPVRLTSATLVVGKLSTLIKIHGSFMTAAWIGFVSVGILIARHYKEVWMKYKLCGVKVWFSIHRCFMLLSVALIVAGFIAIFVDVNGWSEVGPNPHPVLGVIATVLAVLQPFIAACRPQPTSPKRPIFRWIHGLVGNGAQLVAVVNMFFVVSLKSSNVPQAFNWVLVTFIIFHCLVHLLIHLHSCFMERERERDSNTKLHQFQLGDGYDINQDAPGSAFKKFALGLYSMVTTGLTIALILMICLN